LPSNQIVTLPSIPELFDPEFLDLLLPPNADGSIPGEQELERAASNSPDVFAGPGNVAATKKAATFKSTGSATLDAFNGINVRSLKSLNAMNTLLQASWAEDADITLRIIWYTRSIHDGKGEKELFYRYVFIPRDHGCHKSHL
jgi:hypothetical protein